MAYIENTYRLTVKEAEEEITLHKERIKELRKALRVYKAKRPPRGK